MATLKIQGSDKKIKQLARELKVRARHTGLEMSLTLSEDKKLLAKEVIALVEKVETLEDLVQYESDGRATVVTAVKAKKDELSEE